MSLSITAYSARTANTWMIQDTTHISTAVNPSAWKYIFVKMYNINIQRRQSSLVLSNKYQFEKGSDCIHIFVWFYLFYEKMFYKFVKVKPCFCFNHCFKGWFSKRVKYEKYGIWRGLLLYLYSPFTPVIFQTWTIWSNI